LSSQRVFLISIPKCGTHLLAELIKELTGKNYVSVGTDDNSYSISGSDVTTIKSKLKNLNNTFLLGHTTYDPKLERLLKKMGIITFYIYRDPRDHMVSYAFYVQRPSAPLFVHDWVKKNSFDQILTSFLTGDFLLYKYWYAKRIDDFYNCFLPWRMCKHVCAVRFEDLVGPMGGGTAQAQRSSIQKIAHHLGIDLSEDGITDITEKIFGKGLTFRRGKIGSWKSHFSENHKKLFKRVAGNLLVELGYEKNADW